MSNQKNTISIPWLDDVQPCFPDTKLALPYPPGLLAAGGNLNPETLLKAYKKGIFPWYNDNEPILWWSPEPRCVLFTADFHASKSLRKYSDKANFIVRFDSQFDQVIKCCSEREQTWISQDIRDAYFKLHQLGYAHSVEVFQQEKLVGGLYGVAIGRIFFGESMFSNVPNASKFALWKFSSFLSHQGYKIIDCQQETDHLLSLGATSIQREEFETLLIKEQSLSGLPVKLWREITIE